MRLYAALEHLEGGCPIRRAGWLASGIVITATGIEQYGQPYRHLFLTPEDLLAHDWVIALEAHDFAWALQRIEAGRKVRRRGWAFGLHISNAHDVLHLEDVKAWDWEEMF